MNKLDRINGEIINRVIDLILKGYTRDEIKLHLMEGKITSVKMPNLVALKYIDDALNILNSPSYIKDYGLYALYRGAIEKKDFKTAFSILKEMGTSNNEVVINVIKD